MREDRCIKSFDGDLRKTDFFEDLDIGRSIILGWTFNQLAGWSMNWTDVAQDKNWWQPLLNVLMNFLVSIKCVEFLH